MHDEGAREIYMTMGHARTQMTEIIDSRTKRPIAQEDREGLGLCNDTAAVARVLRVRSRHSLRIQRSTRSFHKDLCHAAVVFRGTFCHAVSVGTERRQ